MELKKFKIEKVAEDGSVKDGIGGSVHTEGGVTVVRGKCPMKGCHCSDGFSITLTMPRTDDGIVEGIICKFDSLKELEKHLK